MIRFGSGPVTMMLGLILATGSAVPIIARCGGTGVLAKGSGGTHSVGETKVSPAVAKARDLESELERLRTERILWDAERALALTEKAYDAGCQREFLETLLERRVALQRCDGLMDMVIFALSCVTVYNSAPESEWKSFAPIFRLQPVVGVNGREAGALFVKTACRSGWRPSPHQVMEIAFLAIHTYQDQRARDLLRKLASTQYEGDLRDWFPMLAWQLLLHYEGRAGLRSAFRKAISGAAVPSSYPLRITEWDMMRRLWSADHQISPSRLINNEGYIATNEAGRWLAVDLIQQLWAKELEFIESLEDRRRERYLQIRLMRLTAVTQAYYGPRPRPDPAMLAESSIAMWLATRWEDGDERFLPQLIESARELRIAIAEAPISEAGLAWLKEQAESGPWSDGVKAAIRSGLEQREKRQKSLERQNE